MFSDFPILKLAKPDAAATMVTHLCKKNDLGFFFFANLPIFGPFHGDLSYGFFPIFISNSLSKKRLQNAAVLKRVYDSGAGFSACQRLRFTISSRGMGSVF